MAKTETALKDRAGATPPAETTTRERTAPVGAKPTGRVVLAMNVSMVGHSFNYVPGDTVSVPPAVAYRWLETGAARKTKAGTEAMYEYEPASPAPKPAKGQKAAKGAPQPDDEGDDAE
jgi:hypothetical protein